MADDLKRVGIKLTADGAKDYKNALKECSAATKENYTELKLAQSQYDKNTSSTKKLEDRQKYLAKQTDVYKDKVKILNAQLEEMENAENRDEVAISKKRAEINKTQAKLNEYEKGLADVNKQLEEHDSKLNQWSKNLKNAGGKLQEVGGKMQEVGKTMTTHVTAPIVGGAAASVAAFNEVDGAMDILVQKTGATGKALEDMEDVVEHISTTIPTSFDTAATAVGEVNTRFGLTGQALDTLSTKFVQFAELNGTDVSSSIDNTQKALSAFGLGADQAGMLLDVLNRTGQNTGVSMDTLTNGLVQNGAAFQEMGLSIDQATVFMGQMEKSGANSETVMQGLRKALKNATADGIPFNQALSDLQNTIKNGKGSMDGLTASYELFGKSGDQIYEAVKNGTIDFTQLANSQSILADSADSVGKSYEGTVDPIDQAKMAMNEAKLIGADIVTSAAPMIRDALMAVRDVVKDLREWWSGLSEDEQQNILKMAAVAAAIGPLLTILGTVISVIGTISSAVSALLPVLGAAAGAIGAISAPVLIVIGVIAALVAGIILLATHWDQVKEAAGKFADGVKDSWNQLKQSTKAAVDDMVSRWNKWKADTGQKIADTVTGAKAKFGEMREGARAAMDAIKDKAGAAWNTVKEKTGSAFSAVKSHITNNLQKARETQSAIVGKISSGIGSAWDKVSSKTSSVFGSVRDKIGDMMDGARDKVKNAIAKIKGFFNFKWSLPKIKLPHFSIQGQFSLNPPSVPYLDVDWYAKAYQRAAYYDSPSVRSDGRGFGDRQGGEFAVGERHLRNVVREASGSNLEHKVDQLIDLLSAYLSATANQQTNIVLDSGVLVGQLTPKIDSELGALNKRKGRGL